MLVQIVTFLYIIFNAVRVFSYVPQIIAVYKDKSPALAISLATWGFWTIANFMTGMYATVKVPDFFLAIMSYGNALGCIIVVSIVIYKRQKYRNPIEVIVNTPAGQTEVMVQTLKA